MVFFTYTDLVFRYTSRLLTFQSDILRAFAGIMRLIESKMTEGTMVFGMPSTDFAFIITFTSKQASRRQVGTCPASGQLIRLPSWSWAGWMGEIRWLWLDGRKLATTDPAAIVTEFEVGNRESQTWRHIGVNGDPASSYVLKFCCLVASTAERRPNLFDQDWFDDLQPWDILPFGRTIQCEDTVILRLVKSKIFINRSFFDAYECIAARWTNKEEAVCERIGLVVVECDVWDMDAVEKTPMTVYLE